MNKSIQPTYNLNTAVKCSSCGVSFTTGSVLESIRTEICSECHPFYTGKAKIVDTENLVKKFVEKKKQVQHAAIKHKMEKQQIRKAKTMSTSPQQSLTLKDMLKQMS